jgi:hypothetical protein
MAGAAVHFLFTRLEPADDVVASFRIALLICLDSDGHQYLEVDAGLLKDREVRRHLEFVHMPTTDSEGDIQIEDPAGWDYYNSVARL